MKLQQFTQGLRREIAGKHYNSIFLCMPDISLIKETYASMANEQLIIFAKEDAHAISYEAYIALKREIIKRKLDPSVIAELEKLRVDEAKKKVIQNLEREDFIINNSLWQFVFQQKAERKTNTEIIEGLIQKGVLPETAQDAVGKIEPYARDIFNKTRKAMLISFGLILLGVLLCCSSLIEPACRYFFVPGLIALSRPLIYLKANNKAYRLSEKVVEAIDEEKVI